MENYMPGSYCNRYSFTMNIYTNKFQVNESIPPPPPCQLLCIVNPCQNGGRHVSFIPTTKTSPRFKCECAPGYVGNICQNIAKSCRDYAKGTRKPGMYKIFNRRSPISVFCDFDNDTGMAWTLIQTYAYQYNSMFKNLSFYTNDRVNQGHFNWEKYRQSRWLMNTVKEDSTKFRMTCNYDKDGVVYRDYLQASIKQVNLLGPLEGCQFVEFVDIRGQNCTNCTVYIHQSEIQVFHVDSFHNHNCGFLPTGGIPCDTNKGEDNFGYYECVNRNHRCTSSLTATSQTWLGGI